MLKRLVLLLALVVGALALAPASGQAMPFGTVGATIAKDGAIAAEPVRWRRYRHYGYRYYRPRRYYARRYYAPRYYYPRRHHYRRYW